MHVAAGPDAQRMRNTRHAVDVVRQRVRSYKMAVKYIVWHVREDASVKMGTLD